MTAPRSLWKFLLVMTFEMIRIADILSICNWRSDREARSGLLGLRVCREEELWSARSQASVSEDGIGKTDLERISAIEDHCYGDRKLAVVELRLQDVRATDSTSREVRMVEEEVEQGCSVGCGGQRKEVWFRFGEARRDKGYSGEICGYLEAIGAFALARANRGKKTVNRNGRGYGDSVGLLDLIGSSVWFWEVECEERKRDFGPAIYAGEPRQDDIGTVAVLNRIAEAEGFVHWAFNDGKLRLDRGKLRDIREEMRLLRDLRVRQSEVWSGICGIFGGSSTKRDGAASDPAIFGLVGSGLLYPSRLQTRAIGNMPPNAEFPEVSRFKVVLLWLKI
ncbi:hypothetical protein M5K25_001846 [Dendrobium thyrsiflorum]|uniref:Uncharacterized protein n=1 Tax=Dendrobium thyrsiflorum TaxID=117978 RepID=A0ABD0W1D2_DENTH